MPTRMLAAVCLMRIIAAAAMSLDSLAE